MFFYLLASPRLDEEHCVERRFWVTFSQLLTKNFMNKFRTYFSAASRVKYMEVFPKKVTGSKGFESKTDKRPPRMAEGRITQEQLSRGQ